MASFKEGVLGRGEDENMVDLGDEEDGFVSDDNQVDEDGDGPWYSMGMMRAEKVKARRPWKLKCHHQIGGKKKWLSIPIEKDIEYVENTKSVFPN